MAFDSLRDFLGSLERMCVYTNQVPGGYMRASGELQTVFSVESHMRRMPHRSAAWQGCWPASAAPT